MAKLNQLKVDNNNIFDINNRIDWTRFKNTPSTLVSASGHNHDDLYYKSSVVNDKFKLEEDKIDLLEKRIEVLSYKTDIMMAGGFLNDTKIHNYNFSTEVTNEISTNTNMISINTPGISSKEFGYFTNKDKMIDKFYHFTLVIESILQSNIEPKASLIDFAVQSLGFITDGIGWNKLNQLLDIWETKNDNPVDVSGRTFLSSSVTGYCKGSDLGMVKELTYTTEVLKELSEIRTIGITTGLNKSSNLGYWISKINGNYEHNYLTESFRSINIFIDDMDNSSTSTTEFFGMIVAGGIDGNLTNKLMWSTLSITQSISLSLNKSGASSIEL